MTTQTIDIWNKGHWLAGALLVYSPAELKKAYEKALNVGYLETLTEELKVAAEAGKSGAQAFSIALNQAAPVMLKRNETRRALETFIKQHLLRGNLIGYGFEPPRQMASQPFEIASAHWNGRIEWDEGKLQSQGLQFEQIRLVTPNIREAILQKTSRKFLPTRPQGRPSVGPSIEAAFTALHKAGKIDPSQSQGSHYPQVRAWLALNVPDLKTPADKISEKTLYRHFSPLFKKL